MRVRSLIMLTIAATSWGTLQVIDKVVLTAGADPTAYTIVRIAIAFVVLAFYSNIRRPAALRAIFRRDSIRDLALMGILASGIGLVVQMIGLKLTSVTRLVVLLTLVAPLTSLFAALFLGEKLQLRFWGATLLMLVGVLSIYRDAAIHTFGVGDLLILIAIAGFAYSNIQARKLMNTLPTVTVTMGRLFYGLCSICIFLPFLKPDFSTLLPVIPLIIFGGGLFALRIHAYYKGIEYEGAAVAANFLLITPVVTAIEAALFLGEPLARPVVEGILLVILGGYLLTRWGSRGRVVNEQNSGSTG